MHDLKVGDKAPEFTAEIETGEQVSLGDYRGKKLILYFYPKDNTPTCTVESCNLRDHYKSLVKEGYEVLGVSPDSKRRHQNFIKKFDLPFHLIADTELEVIQKYGVWGHKKFMGREYDGLHRTTYVIDEEGKIEDIIYKVKSKEHAEQILG